VAFVFRMDSQTLGRYWVRSERPWALAPRAAVSVLAPKRFRLQVAQGMYYRFSIQVCAASEHLVNGAKEVTPYRTDSECEAWFNASVTRWGIKAHFFSLAMQTLLVPYEHRVLKLPYASIEGMLEIVDPEPVPKLVLRGMGSYRRMGLGWLQLSA
jgi:hypothetical protein